MLFIRNKIASQLTNRLICGFSSELPKSSYKPQKYAGRQFDDVLSKRKKHMPQFQTYYYKKPLLISEGHGQYLWDHEGRQYLDMCAGISTVNCGHSHPRITKVVQDQVSKLSHISPIFLQQYQGDYSKKLGEFLGQGYDNVFVVNSGAQANDFALLLCRLYTNCHKIISLRYGYHGLVGGSQGVTNVHTWNHPIIRGYETEKIAFPSEYRGNLKSVDEYMREAEEVIQSTTSGKVAGFIAEPIQGVVGAYPLPPGYLPRIYELIRRYGGLCISDEVQTGFGRIGKDMWGFKKMGAKPDIITMAKGIGNGFPMAAVATRKQVMDVIKKVHFNTFGGGPIQCRVGMEVIDIIQQEKLHQNAEVVGAHLRKKLKEIADKYDKNTIGDVRGHGLMMGIQLVKDKKTKEPAPELTAELNEMTKDRQVLVSKGGLYGNVFRMIPPLCMTKADADYVAHVFDECLKKLHS